MTMTTNFPSCLRALLVLCIATIVSPLLMSPAHSQTVVVMVNGEPVTDFDIEQRSKLDFLTLHKQPARQEVINELIDEKLKIKEAKKFGVDPSGADIDQSYGEMAGRMHITADQLTKSLEAQGMRADTLKARIRADMVWTALVRGRYKERLQVGEADVVGDVGHAALLIGEQPCRMAQPRAQEILMRRDAEHRGKQPQEMEWADAGLRGGVLEFDGFMRMRIDP